MAGASVTQDRVPWLVAGVVAVLVGVGANAWLRYAPTMQVLIIGHRGSPGHLPDHTLEGYALAVEQGADFIEPDLVSTSDGHLIARHENDLTETTDVSTKFPDRKTTKIVDGVMVEGWFSEDFSLAEIKTLFAVQPYPDRPHAFDGRYRIPTFEEILELRERLSVYRPIGVYPETKHPSYFRSLGLPIEPVLFQALARHGLDRADAPVFVQSFEPRNLEHMDTAVPKILLIGGFDQTPFEDERTYGALLADLPALREQVDGIGVHKDYVWGPDGPTSLLARAHDAGLVVHVYTFRNEARKLGPAAEGDPRLELRRFMAIGVDGVFADYPEVAVEVRSSLH